LIAGGAALAAMLTGRLGTPDRAEAGHTGVADGTFHLEATNNQGGTGEASSGVTSTTRLVANGSTDFGAGIGFGGALRVVNLAGAGVTVQAATGYHALTAITSGGTWAIEAQNPDHTGILSLSTNGTGITSSGGTRGIDAYAASAEAVRGQSTSGIGVHGESKAPGSTQAGVLGVSPSGAGVQGTSTTGFGVQGLSQNAYGVSGNSTTQAGVWGSSSSNVGVLGTSTSGVGVSGISSSSNGVNALSTSGIGIYAACTGGQAGRFEGDVLVIGNLTVTGSYPQSAAVGHPDGTLRRMYSLDTPEAFYEDVGQGSLANGVGAVRLDPDFAALVLDDTYHVFLTPRGDCKGLYISNQSAGGFEVRELQGGTSSIGFSYRVLGRPRRTVSPRLERVTVPPSPPQPRVDHTEPLNVPAVLRDLPSSRPGSLPIDPGSVRDGQPPGARP
jgi:hypothetical protein